MFGDENIIELKVDDSNIKRAGWHLPSSKEFYKHAKTKNGLKVQEFFFDKDHPYDLAEKRRII